MAKIDAQVLTQIVEAIAREVGPKEIWPFGSRARGEGATESDVDLLVVEREPFGPERSRRRELTGSTTPWCRSVPVRRGNAGGGVSRSRGGPG